MKQTSGINGDELLRLRQLEDDWDGEGALAPPPEVVDQAIQIVQILRAHDAPPDRVFPPPDRVFPRSNGTIYFEWFTPLEYWEIEVLSPNNVQVRKILRGTDQCLTYQL